MTIREATAADVDAVLQLIRANPELPQWSRSALAPEASPLPSGPRRRLLVDQDDGCLVGFAQAAIVVGEAELESMAVAETHRGQRIGTRLLGQVVDLARADGAQVLRLEVRRSNSAARRLYEGAGMTTVGTRREYYRNPVEDAVLMELRWNDPLANG